jgi:threonine aldolase
MFRLPASLAHRVGDTAGFGQRLRERKLLINRSGPGRFRAVTHLDVASDDIDDAISRLANAIGR